MSTKYFNDNEQLVDIAGKAAMDAQLSTTSTNGVQNKIVTSAINEINTRLQNPILLKTVLQNGEQFTIPTLSDYRYLLVLVTTTDNSFVVTQGIIPVAFAKTMSNVHKNWMFNTYDGTRYYGRINVEAINSNGLTATFSTDTVAGMYIYGIK